MARETQKVKSIAIIEDHPTTRKGIEAAVTLDPNLRVGIAVSNVEEFLHRRSEPVDLVILDLGLHGGGVQGTPAVAKLCSLGLPVLVVSMREEPAPVLDSIAAGAKGYVTKEAEPEEIARA